MLFRSEAFPVARQDQDVHQRVELGHVVPHPEEPTPVLHPIAFRHIGPKRVGLLLIVRTDDRSEERRVGEGGGGRGGGGGWGGGGDWGDVLIGDKQKRDSTTCNRIKDSKNLQTV